MRTETYSTPGALLLNLEIPAGEIEIETSNTDETQIELEAIAKNDAVRDAQRRGRMGAGDPVLIAEIMWALTYGVARLGTSSQLTQQRLPIEALAVQGVRWVSDGCLTPI